MFFISLQKLFSLSRKSDFRIWEIPVCWCCQMPKHRTRNTFYWLTWQVNFVLMKFDQFMPIYKRKYFIKKLHKNCDLKTCSRPFCVCKNWPQPLLKNWTFEASYLHWICLRKTIKICPNQHRLPQIRFYRGLFENQKGPGTTFFIEYFNNKFSFVMLHKQDKFHWCLLPQDIQ